MQTRDKTGDGDILIKNPQERLLKAHRSALRIPASAVENSGPKVHRNTPLVTLRIFMHGLAKNTITQAAEEYAEPHN